MENVPDPNCKECNGHGYIEIDCELLTIQSNEHYVEERWVPVLATCHCLDQVEESFTKDNYNETINRIQKPCDEQWF